MSPERRALLERAKTLQSDLHHAALEADQTGSDEAIPLWEAYSQAGDVVEELSVA